MKKIITLLVQERDKLNRAIRILGADPQPDNHVIHLAEHAKMVSTSRWRKRQRHQAAKLRASGRRRRPKGRA